MIIIKSKKDAVYINCALQMVLLTEMHLCCKQILLYAIDNPWLWREASFFTFIFVNGGLTERNVNICIVYTITNSVIKQEVQTVSHNYIHIIFLPDTCFRFLWKTHMKQYKI
jgi:hypothetical protein